MSAKRVGLLLATLLSLSACTTVPNVMVLPGVGKPFDEFQRDDVVCRQWAAQQVETKPGDGPGSAAGVGRASGRSVQDRYDTAYQQCMYARGNQIPGIVPASPPSGMPSPPAPPVSAPPSHAAPPPSSVTPAPGTSPRY
jgi:hypothetical protein